MIYTKLVLQDFRQFLGRQELTFSSDKEKTVTLIHAENGVGKTTFLNAIYWCLYGHILPGTFDNELELVNDYARESEGVTSCSVELEFEHETDVYRIVRSYDETQKINSVDGFVVVGANQDPIRDIHEVIERIMPRAMGKYFLMAGETLQTLGRADTPKFLGAVRTILGFDHAEKVIGYLEGLMGRWNKELAKASRLDKKVRDAMQEKGKLVPEIEQMTARILEDVKTSNSFEQQLTEINEKLSKIKTEDLHHLNSRKLFVEKELQGIPRQRKNADANKAKMVQNFGYSIFGHSFFLDASKKLQDFTKDRKLPSGYKDIFIKELLEEGICICGTALTEGCKEHKSVESYYVGATTKEQETHIDKAKMAASQLQDMAEEYTKNLSFLIQREQLLDQAEADYKRELSALESQIDAIDDTEKDNLIRDQKFANEMYGNAHSSKYDHEKELQHLKERLDGANREIKQAGTGDQLLGELRQKEDFVEKVLALLSAEIVREDASAKTDVERFLNDKLEAFSRKSYRAQINNSFEFTLHKNSGAAIDKSTGEGKLLSIAFVSSLIELARERSGESSEYFVKGTVAPFAIDAPFTALDDSYRGAVAQFLPDCSEQFIVLISSGDWTDAVIKPLEDRIGKEYLLVAHSDADDSEKTIKDKIKIWGKEYPLTQYNAEKPHTSIQEIS